MSMTDPKEPQSPEDVAGIGAEQAQDEEQVAMPLPVEENDANAQPG